MLNVYHVMRDGEDVLIYQLSKPDLAGNQHWVLVSSGHKATIVVIGRRYYRLNELDDLDIVRLFRGEQAELAQAVSQEV